jgi:hypothetical protein
MHRTRIVIGDVAQVFLDEVNTGGSDGGSDHALFFLKKNWKVSLLVHLLYMSAMQRTLVLKK